VYTLDNSLYAAPFDVDQLAVTGDAVQMVPDVRTAFQGGGTGAAFYAVAASGTLIYVPGAIRSALRALVWVDGKGQKVSVPLPARDYAHPRVSPDGARAAVDIAEDGDTSIWVGDMTRGTLSRVTPKGASRYAPVWTPDGKQLIYTGMANGDWAFFRKSADGTGAEERLALVPGVDALQAGNWSPDGKQLVFEMTRPGKRGDIGVLSLQGQPSWMPLLETEANEFTPAISPDGRWVAYGSNETANPEIYVQRFPDLGDRQQVSTDGGLDPWWGPDGRKLSYIEPAAGLGGLMEVTITTGSTLSIGKPVSRFPFSYVRLFDQGHNHDIAPDGQRFLMVANQETTQSGANSGIPRVAVVVNWFDELRRFVRTN
jgi:Tol biopolymer transport system component